jgi:hypothetical protein
VHMSDELLVGRAGRFLSPPSTYIPPTLAITRIGLRYNNFFLSDITTAFCRILTEFLTDTC